jgi:hypothetical protein
MSLKDKLEVGLKPDAPFRPDNLPDFQQDDKACRRLGSGDVVETPTREKRGRRIRRVYNRRRCRTRLSTLSTPSGASSSMPLHGG